MCIQSTAIEATSKTSLHTDLELGMPKVEVHVSRMPKVEVHAIRMPKLQARFAFAAAIRMLKSPARFGAGPIEAEAPCTGCIQSGEQSSDSGKTGISNQPRNLSVVGPGLEHYPTRSASAAADHTQRLGHGSCWI